MSVLQDNNYCSQLACVREIIDALEQLEWIWAITLCDFYTSLVLRNLFGRTRVSQTHNRFLYFLLFPALLISLHQNGGNNLLASVFVYTLKIHCATALQLRPERNLSCYVEKLMVTYRVNLLMYNNSSDLTCFSLMLGIMQRDVTGVEPSWDCRWSDWILQQPCYFQVLFAVWHLSVQSTVISV